MNLKIQPAKKENLYEIANLLSDNQLPTVDICDDSVKLFVGVISNEIIGIIGIEKYKHTGLLRSLAVKDLYKNREIGKKLVKQIFNFCIFENIEELYLLTTTAEKYFDKLGFQKIDRLKVPDVVKQTREFKDICPLSAVVMYKRINH